MTSHRLIATVVFESDNGELPSADEIARTINDALLARKLSGWSIMYAPTAKPRWRVKVANANIRGGPGTSFAVIGSAKQGDVFEEVGSKDAWIQTARGWLACSVLTKEIA